MRTFVSSRLFRRARLCAVAAGALGFSLQAACGPALAASTSYVTGLVDGPDGKPLANADVSLIGGNAVQHVRSDAAGHFAFPSVVVGEYTVQAEASGGSAAELVALTSAGVSVTLRLATIREIGRVAVQAVPFARRSGTDVTYTAKQLQRSPTGNSIPEILAQLPDAARGSNGQIHVNGDHGGVNYYVDGVQLPTGLNRVLGNEIDGTQIGFLDAIEGAYPAQYGDRFGAVLDIGTKVQSGPAGANASVQAGSFGTLDTSVGYHLPLAHGGALSVAARQAQTNRGIDPPVQDYVHARSSSGSQFVRLTLPAHGLDTYNVDVLHSLQTFQIPPDTANGVPATTNDSELQNDTFVSAQYRHAIGDHGSLTFGPSLKISRIADFPDLANDLASASAPPPAGNSTNCTDFSDCPVYSVAADRLDREYRFNADYDLRSAAHDVKAGGIYGTALVDKTYAITLQPYSALNPAGTFTTTDSSPNVVHQQEAYVQDTWKLGPKYLLDYGLRMDAFQIASNGFDRGFSQSSPRVKLTRLLGSRASVYAYYGRLFVPFSFENVSPATAQSLYLPGSIVNGNFDLRPERDSLYELGGHLPLGKGELGLRISHKVATDYLDDTQVGATNLHQDINFPQGRVDSQTLAYQQPFARNGRAYLSVAHSLAVTSANCETQLLQNCAAAGPPGGDFVQADHDQRWTVTGGFLVNERRGGWYSANGEYGSGLSLGDTSVCPGGNAVNCKVPPHLVFSAEKGWQIARATTFALSLRNIFNDRYALTIDSALQGTHYAAPRAIYVVLRYDGK